MALPPTLTFQYHFNPQGKVRLYVGVGANYTIFYSEDASSSLVGAIGLTTVSVDDTVGIDLDPIAAGIGSGYRFGVRP